MRLSGCIIIAAIVALCFMGMAAHPRTVEGETRMRHLIYQKLDSLRQGVRWR